MRLDTDKAEMSPKFGFLYQLNSRNINVYGLIWIRYLAS